MGHILEKVFIEVLNMGLTASVMIAGVFLVRLLLKKAPKIYSYILWSIVLFRLLCPVSFETEISLLGALQSETSVDGRMEYIPQDIGYQLQPEVQMPIEAVNEVVNESLPKGEFGDSVNPLQIWLYFGARVWILGIVVMLAHSGLSLKKLRKQLKLAVCEDKNIYRMPGKNSPFVYGVFNPRIYLPDHLEETEKDYVLLHEQVHIRRGDHIYRLLAYLAVCVHWFNPLVWAAFFISGRDMEISCDEAVIRKMGSGVKKEYSASLLNLACGEKIVKGIPVAFGESDTKSRIKHVLKYKKPAKIISILAVVLCVIAAILFIGNPKRNEIIETLQTKTKEITYQIENPSWEHYCSDAVKKSKIKPFKLELISEVENDFTDFAWLEENEITRPEFPYNDEYYSYKFTSNYYYEATELIISGENHTYTIDMNSFCSTPDKVYESDDSFITNNMGYVNFAKIKDGILYVSTGHCGFAKNEPSTGYITAIDLENGEVLWKSAPRVSDAQNFEIIDDVIVCGYGINDENDYLYILNRSNGQIIDQIPLKSEADYIVAKDSTLYVRTYDLSYEFRINDTDILNIETEPTKIKSDNNEIPDTLYVGEGFSISIPDEGWQIYDETLESPALMAAVLSSEISVWIECYKEEELFSVEERLLEEGYTYNFNLTKLKKLEGNILTEVRLYEYENDIWSVFSTHNVFDSNEWRSRLDAIAKTFTVIQNVAEEEYPSKIIYEGCYFDGGVYQYWGDIPLTESPMIYCEIWISNVTETTFDFLIKEVVMATDERTIVLPLSTAKIVNNGWGAIYEGEEFTLSFEFPDFPNTFPKSITVNGWEKLNGNNYMNNSIPGHESG